jgi:hypothetical protein
MRASVKIWFAIFDKHTAKLRQLGGRPEEIYQDHTVGPYPEADSSISSLPVLKKTQSQSPGNPSPEMRLLIDNLITHLKLGWSLFQENATLAISRPDTIADKLADLVRDSEDSTNHNKAQADLAMAAALADRSQQTAPPLVVEDQLENTEDESRKPWWSTETRFADFFNFTREIIRLAAHKQAIKLPAAPTQIQCLQTFCKLTQITPEKQTFANPNNREHFALSIARLLTVDDVHARAMMKRYDGSLSRLLAAVEDKLATPPRR